MLCVSFFEMHKNGNNVNIGMSLCEKYYPQGIPGPLIESNTINLTCWNALDLVLQ